MGYMPIGSIIYVQCGLFMF